MPRLTTDTRRDGTYQARSSRRCGNSAAMQKMRSADQVAEKAVQQAMDMVVWRSRGVERVDGWRSGLAEPLTVAVPRLYGRIGRQQTAVLPR